MKPLARLAAFAALLVAVFGAAAFAGGAIDPDASTSDAGSHTTRTTTDGAHAGTATSDHGEAPAGGHDAGHGTGGAGQAPAVKGLAISQAGYTLELADGERGVARDTWLRFRIVDTGGKPLTRYAVTHDRRMHLIVVRRDQRGFQHLHPRMSRDGTWTTRIRFQEAGSYRVFADFETADTAVTLGADLAVDGPAGYRALPAPQPLADTGDGYQVRLDSDPVRAGRPAELRFTVHKDGRAVHTDPYLGAGGHLVALRHGDLAFLHTHPVDAHGGDDGGEAHDESITFETTYPSAGRYRLFLQFKHDGRVHTAEFTQEVAR